MRDALLSAYFPSNAFMRVSPPLQLMLVRVGQVRELVVADSWADETIESRRRSFVILMLVLFS